MKKYTVTGQVKRGTEEYKFFIFGDSEEVGDYVLMSNLAVYCFYKDKLETSTQFDRFKDKAVVINRKNNKGMLYDPASSTKEQVIIQVENENNHFTLVEAGPELLNFLKELE